MSLTTANDKTESNGGAPQDPSAANPYQENPVLNAKTWRIGTLTYTKAGLIILFGWLLWGDFAWSMKERAVGPVFQFLLTQYHASNTTFALLTSIIPSVIGLFLGPIISYRSDRYRSRMGRRIPFLLLTTPVAALAMAAIAFSPSLGEYTHKLLGVNSLGLENSILFYFGLFWVIFEIATIAANSVFGAFVNDVVPRELLGRFFGLFRAMSLIAGMIFNLWLLEKAEEHYLWLFVSISSLYGVGFTAMCFKVKEGQYPPPPDPPADKRTRSLPLRFWDATAIYFKECYSHPYYLWVFIAFIVSGLAFSPVNIYSVKYALQLEIPMADYGKFLFSTYGISLVLSYPLGALADRFHPLRVGMVALLLYGIAATWGGLAADTVYPFALAFIAHGVLSGTFFTATASLAQRLYPYDKFAQFASAGGILGSLVSIAFSWWLGHFLDSTKVGEYTEFRYTFIIGAVCAFAGLILMYVVYRRFKALGGPKGYVAPE